MGINIVIFGSIIINRLPPEKDKTVRRVWMLTNIIIRSLLLLAPGWLLTQKSKAVFTIFNKGFDLTSLVLLGGGLFFL